MKNVALGLFFLAAATAGLAQDQQLGARTKAMGGSYTAFEDDPVSVWLNPAGIATQATSMAISYQTYVTYPLHEHQATGSTVISTSTGAETTFVNPAFIPSYLGFVYHLGEPNSGMALGLCYAQPYHLNYSFDKIDDPALRSLVADTNVDQSFSRFRVAFAKDFRFTPAGEAGFLTHVSVGGGVDIGYTRWEFKGQTESQSDNVTAFGGGAGFLLGIYDNATDFKVNLGVAYQSAVNWKFAIQSNILPSFDMPQQLNAGFTFYLLSDENLRATVDFQWIQWSNTAAPPEFAGDKKFRDAVNFSFGLEYRIPVPSLKVVLYPRLGYRRFEAPWSSSRDLPSVADYRLLVDTKASTFDIATFGVGISWSADDGRLRALDLGADAGGDSYNFAIGFTFEF